MSDQVQGGLGGQGRSAVAAPDASGDTTQSKGGGESFQFLSHEQMRALELLSEGKPIAEVATAVGVNRGTVYRWLKTDKYFRATFNAWQLEQRENYRIALFKSAKVAVSRIATMVDFDHNLAWKMAKEMGLVVRPTPLMTDPDQMGREIEIEQQELENALHQREGAGPDETGAVAVQESVANPPVILPETPKKPSEISNQERLRREKVLRDKEADKVATTIG